MKALNSFWFMALAIATACGVAGLVLLKLSAQREPSPQPAKPTLAARSAGPPETAPLPLGGAEALPPPEPALAQPSAPLVEPAATGSNAQRTPTQTGQPGRTAKEPLKDPLAREALAFVGADPEADAYWHEAINDPSLSAHERQDLIEDLNEDGLSDPKHPTAEDLQLILSRLQLIEQLAPQAMDQVNADAFQEAYRDLINLANLALGGGVPVR